MRRVGKNGELECRMEKYLNEEAEPNSERFVPYKEFYNTLLELDIKKLLSGDKNKISAGKQRTKAKNKAILLNQMQSLF